MNYDKQGRCSMSRKQRSRNVAGERNAFYQPKQLTILCIWFFVTMIYVARTFSAVQRAGLIKEGPNVIGGFHLHHWAMFFLVLPVLLVFAFAFREGSSSFNKPNKHGKMIWAICMIGIAICLGLFVDGIVYYDSAIFFEPNLLVLQPLSIKDLQFQLLLGGFWFAISLVLFWLMFKAYRKSNPHE